jgi:hypothetical protein
VKLPNPVCAWPLRPLWRRLRVCPRRSCCLRFGNRPERSLQWKAKRLCLSGLPPRGCYCFLACLLSASWADLVILGLLACCCLFTSWADLDTIWCSPLLLRVCVCGLNLLILIISIEICKGQGGGAAQAGR